MRSMCKLFKVFSILAISSQVYAEVASPVDSQKRSAQSTEEVYVSGSRIRQQSPDTYLSTFSLSQIDLESSGQLLLADSLNRLSVSGSPLTSRSTTNMGLFSPGVSSIDLRNLSPNRTLVLIDGKRVVGGDSERPNVVDLNSIPTDLVERVDIITGGVSAVYGSEAVAGVVNIITKQKINTHNLRVQTGVSSEGDGEQNKVSLSGGLNVISDKWNLVYSLGYSDLSEVRSADRDFSQNDEFLGDFQDYSAFSPQGALFTDFGLFTEDSDGTWLKEFDVAEDGFNRADYRLLQIPLERYDITINNQFELSDELSLGFDVSHAYTESQSQIEPTVAGFVIGVGEFPMYMPDNNPFIPSEITDLYSDAALPLPGFFDFLRRFTEVGPTIANQERDTSRVLIDLSASLGELRWDSYFQWGKSTREQTTLGNYNTLRFQNGLEVETDPDNPGSFRCIDAQARAEGCVPINIFGENSISQAAVDYVEIESFDSSEISQRVFASEIEGLGPELTDAGQIKFAGGFEWRKESFKSTADDFALTGYSSSNVFSEIEGDYSVGEIFTEVSVPLLSGKSGVEYLGANAAVRYSDYDTIGHANSWQTGLDLQVDPSFAFRMSYSKATRAPNIVELFDAGAQSFFEFIDPCTGGGTGGDGNTEANCSAEGVPSDFDPGEFGSAALGIQSGNQNLQEEVAYTFTLGFTAKPTDTFHVQFDYFDIEVEDAIELISPQFKLNQCYASSDPSSSEFCDGIERAGSGLGYVVTQLDVSLQNLGVLSTRGFDLAVYGDKQFELGRFGYNIHYTRTYESKSDVNGGEINRLGEPGFQKDKAHGQLFYAVQNLKTTWGFRYLGSGVVDNQFDTSIWPDNYNLPEVWYHDINVQYDLSKQGLALFLGINNVEDKQPPYIPSPSFNNIPGTNTAAGVYDVVGRYFYAGLEAKF